MKFRRLKAEKNEIVTSKNTKLLRVKVDNMKLINLQTEKQNSRFSN